MDNEKLNREVNILTAVSTLIIILIIAAGVYVIFKFDLLSNITSGEIQFIILPFALFFLFLLIRELITWYWKINKIVDLLERIEENTRKLQVEDESSLNKLDKESLGQKDLGGI